MSKEADRVRRRRRRRCVPLNVCMDMLSVICFHKIEPIRKTVLMRWRKYRRYCVSTCVIVMLGPATGNILYTRNYKRIAIRTYEWVHSRQSACASVLCVCMCVCVWAPCAFGLIYELICTYVMLRILWYKPHIACTTHVRMLCDAEA